MDDRGSSNTSEVNSDFVATWTFSFPSSPLRTKSLGHPLCDIVIV
ncbi:hypothetical protein SNOG_01833 [Parastagonospora nodorum SN15]|uniref:Uncharacterized protein n=1 Tax=Phaeosphaeria nodorum (strain SN15 / ATCC MYA-4574 / FGSC 10173) TaxID=321614 RepID=Q0V2D1_PHANO|nr:hypothetical protein SNOG_01833 [Parastagonospora nodorum SN15]EAT91482.1 hypothetical protein SNOG_01833 [Parastagonospora nodorum SN15]